MWEQNEIHLQERRNRLLVDAARQRQGRQLISARRSRSGWFDSLFAFLEALARVRVGLQPDGGQVPPELRREFR